MPSGHKCENGTNVDKLDNRVVGLVEVNAWSLREPFRNQLEPFSNQSNFISKYRAIDSTFDFKNPFVANKGLIRIMGNKIPSVITHLGFKFLGHGIMPNRNGSNINKSCGLSLGPVNGIGGVRKTTKKSFGFGNDCFALSDHGMGTGDGCGGINSWKCHRSRGGSFWR